MCCDGVLSVCTKENLSSFEKSDNLIFEFYFFSLLHIFMTDELRSVTFEGPPCVTFYFFFLSQDCYALLKKKCTVTDWL